ncbi:ATP-grasp fold amidoligase family protein [Salisediminibacterium halotolerans]|nr:ATP-grasp fold amidoligase family protein [Salisediminibacterium haloalkalitolerans]
MDIHKVEKYYYQGKALAYISDLTLEKQTTAQHIHRVFYKTMQLANQEKPEHRQQLFNEMMKAYAASEVPELASRGMEHGHDVSLAAASSFRALLTHRLRKQQIFGDLPEWFADDKHFSQKLAANLNLSVPEFTGRHYSAAELPLNVQSAVKPVNGAGGRGVYLIHSEDRIEDLKRGEMIASFAELRTRMNTDLEQGHVHMDLWKAEALYYFDARQEEAARDLKFYCFYGKAGLVLEVKRSGVTSYCWWSREGESVQTGKYENKLFKGNGFSESDLIAAEEMSAAVPTPFCRVDFLKTESGLIFGEMTPKPGNYEQFDRETDQRLGEMFLEAEERLYRDSYQRGKSFSSYEETLRNRSVNDID